MPADAASSRAVLLQPRWYWAGQTLSATPNPRLLLSGGDLTLLSPSDEVSQDIPRISLPRHLVIPGLINFHTHLELSDVLPPAIPRIGEPDVFFAEWLLAVIRQGPQTPEAAAAAALKGAWASLGGGVTTVVDITRRPTATRPALADLPLRVVSCGEVTGLARREELGAPMRDAALEPPPAQSRIRTGLSPHAPYSTAERWYRRLAHDARVHRLLLTTHLAETAAERLFLSHHAGPLRDLWNRLDPDQSFAPVPPFAGGPVRWLESLGVLEDAHLFAAHVNDVSDDDLELLARRHVVVVHCPRTHAYFGRPPFDLARYQSAGVTVRLGTDSVASAGGLNLLADLRLMAQQHPALFAPELFDLVRPPPLSSPLPSSSLIPTSSADLIAFECHRPDPLDDLFLRDDNYPTHVWVGGTLVWGRQ